MTWKVSESQFLHSHKCQAFCVKYIRPHYEPARINVISCPEGFKTWYSGIVLFNAQLHVSVSEIPALNVWLGCVHRYQQWGITAAWFWGHWGKREVCYTSCFTRTKTSWLGTCKHAVHWYWYVCISVLHHDAHSHFEINVSTFHQPRLECSAWLNGRCADGTNQQAIQQTWNLLIWIIVGCI